MKRSQSESSASAQSKAQKVMLAKRTLPHCSQSAFTAMINMAKSADLSSFPRNRRDYRKMRAHQLSGTPFGPMIVSRTLIAKPPHANKELKVVNPAAYLYTAHNSQGAFFDFWKSRLQATPCSVEKPWRLCLYSDEVVPGNQLGIFHSRKVWVIYFSFLELHPHLGNENAWCPLIAEPTNGLKNIHSGISQVFATVIKLFFCEDFDFRSGIWLPAGGGVRFFAKLSMFLQDGAAHKSVWGCKGDSGTKLCMMCTNLVTEASGLVDEDGEDILVCSLIHEDQLNFASDDDVRASLARLANHKLTSSSGDFKLWEQAIGFTINEHGVLHDESLKDIVMPVSQYCHDWMHGIFATGVFNIVVFLCFMEAKEVCPNVWEVLRDVTLKYTWPKAIKFDPNKNDHLSKTRIKAHTAAWVFKCTASDGLSLLPVMAMFIQTTLSRTPGINQYALDAVVLLCDLVDALVAVQLGLVTAGYLRERVANFLVTCEKAGWRTHFTPKFHWLIHLIAALERRGALPTCWVHERKHRVVKRYANDILNTGVYSTSVLTEAISHQLVEVDTPDAFDASLGLINPRKAAPKERSFVLSQLDLPAQIEVKTSVTARLAAGLICTKTDVVLIKSNDGENFVAAQVWLLYAVEGEPISLVSAWEFKSYNPHQGKAVWCMTDRPIFVGLEDVFCSVIWSEDSPGIAITIVPFQLRGLKAVNE